MLAVLLHVSEVTVASAVLSRQTDLPELHNTDFYVSAIATVLKTEVVSCSNGFVDQAVSCDHFDVNVLA